MWDEYIFWFFVVVGGLSLLIVGIFFLAMLVCAVFGPPYHDDDIV